MSALLLTGEEPLPDPDDHPTLHLPSPSPYRPWGPQAPLSLQRLCVRALAGALPLMLQENAEQAEAEALLASLAPLLPSELSEALIHELAIRGDLIEGGMRGGVVSSGHITRWQPRGSS
jgi:hypothetical protein